MSGVAMKITMTSEGQEYVMALKEVQALDTQKVV